MTVSSSLELHGAAASSSPHSVVHLDSSSILYASNCIINIATPHDISTFTDSTISTVSTNSTNSTNSKSKSNNNNSNQSLVYSVRQTIRTNTVARSDNRSITAIALLNPLPVPVPVLVEGHSDGNQHMKIITCSFSDGTITAFIVEPEHEEEDEEETELQSNMNNTNRIGNVNVNVNMPRYKWTEHIIVGQHNNNNDDVTSATPGTYTSIADIGGIYRIHQNTNKISLNIITASAKGVYCYHHSIPIDDNVNMDIDIDVGTDIDADNTIGVPIATAISCLGNYPTSSVKLTTIDNQILLAVGTALPRNNRLHFYTTPFRHGSQQEQEQEQEYDNQHGQEQQGQWKHQGSVMGHLDWISCLDYDWNSRMVMSPTSSSSSSMSAFQGGILASGSQDARIRLWKLHPPSSCEEHVIHLDTDIGIGIATATNDDEDDDDDDDDDEDLIEEGEARMYIRYVNGIGEAVQIAVTLEALLIGHEEGVTSVRWRPNCEKPCLISSSMDRSILIWMEEGDNDGNDGNGDDGDGHVSYSMNEGTGNVWVPITRVGTAGGVLGGSIASSLLGFINVLWSNCGRQIIGHGFGGALYFWSRVDADGHSGAGGNDKNSTLVRSSAMERWHATPGITGHFRGCSDISWEATKGMYLLSVGMDQTCRLWMELLPSTRHYIPRIWKEVGRPQVHGYDLNTVACIGTGNSTGSGKGELLHRFVSGADEKETRAFDAPIQTMELIERLDGNGMNNSVIANRVQRVERAFIPSLGLSNRANMTDAMEEGAEAGLTKASTNVTVNEVDSDADADPHQEGIKHVKSSGISLAQALPRERDLGVASLWPEVRKLYGHLTEMVCLASTAEHCRGTDEEVLVASSCKARDADSAAIRVWNVERNVCLDVLKVCMYNVNI